MVERQCRKFFAGPGIAGDDGDFFRREKFGDGGAERLRKQGRQLGGLDHDAIARGERVGQRPDSQLKRIVPGADDADDPERLTQHERAAGPEGERGRRPPGFHPGAQALPGVTNGGAAEHDFGDDGLCAGANAKIFLNEIGEAVSMGFKQAIKPVETIGAYWSGGRHVATKGFALVMQHCEQFGPPRRKLCFGRGVHNALTSLTDVITVNIE
ncbi:hypothetical protein MPC4_240068 [Methylocella tundrae]|uniref:Uncharacterized protein n=1 Tax=Methylocella tundrae TaxID=227605 RepID=A0A8B6M640_METTU|nr:hypothetical protein MPC4_240068 [Methylocella tundrae]